MNRAIADGSGSSPHTRGAPANTSKIRRGDRIIPAYAGSTRAPLRRPRESWDHPRIRGEHTDKTEALGLSQGSSPHTRGALASTAAGAGPPRIIPAYAGSTALTSDCSWAGRDHPRIRGEHIEAPPFRAPPMGSSPHTRGARKSMARPSPSIRIIPAYAGSTRLSGLYTGDGQDHPRIRGEHCVCEAPRGGRRGSSPHTRGAHHSRGAASAAPRIIPAYAGSTGTSYRKPTWISGSSPHTRGARKFPVHRVEGLRIIPAYAGSTSASTTSDSSISDHPRIRGEHKNWATRWAAPEGSSPHTRGAPDLRHERRVDGRIIPAYAGSTNAPSRTPESSSDHPRIRGEHDGGLDRQGRGRRIIPAYAGSTFFEDEFVEDERDHPRIRGEHTWKSLQYQGSPP